jgi:hypothetical protein
MFAEYNELRDSIRDQTIQNAPLEPSSATTTVRVRNGETLVTDGPLLRRRSSSAAST